MLILIDYAKLEEQKLFSNTREKILCDLWIILSLKNDFVERGMREDRTQFMCRLKS